MIETYSDYASYARKAKLLSHAWQILDSYDGLLHVSSEGSEIRGEQVWILSEVVHNLLINPNYKSGLENLLQSPNLIDEQRKNVEISLRQILEEENLPADFVREFAEAKTLSVQAYYDARWKADFSIFLPHLQKMIDFSRKYAQFRSVNGTLYESLLNDFDKWLTESDLDLFFEEIKKKLLPVIKILHKQKNLSNPLVVPPERLRSPEVLQFFRERLREMWFDLERGSITEAPASFMLDGNPTDVRICYKNNWALVSMIGSVTHEGWHGIYEQAFSVDDIGLPKWEPASYSIHESQSRLYENHVGFSEEYFLGHLFPQLQTLFPDELGHLLAHDFYGMENAVNKAPKRLDADEVTYHIHILIRYEIERDLVNWLIRAEDLPTIWNQKHKDYLDIDVQNDADGILQDIHWADGSFWYFPTYSLGTIYANQLFLAIEREFPRIREAMKWGNLGFIKEWLNKHVHAHGSFLSSKEIMLQSTWRHIDVDAYVDYVKTKYGKIYWINWESI